MKFMCAVDSAFRSIGRSGRDRKCCVDGRSSSQLGIRECLEANKAIEESFEVESAASLSLTSQTVIAHEEHVAVTVMGEHGWEG